MNEIDVSADQGRQHVLDVSERGVTLDGSTLDVQSVSALTAALGKPRIVEFRADEDKPPRFIHLWDDFGIAAFSPGSDATDDLIIKLGEDPVTDEQSSPEALERTPRGRFPGKLTIVGVDLLDAAGSERLTSGDVWLEFDLGEWALVAALNRTDCAPIYEVDTWRADISQAEREGWERLIRAAEHPIGEVNVSYPVRGGATTAPVQATTNSTVPLVVPVPDEPVLTFSSLAFKLAVVDQLMYVQEVLEPVFDAREFAEAYTEREIDLEEEGYEPIPEIVEWFEKLPVPARLAEQVESLCLDGGCPVYLDVAPLWDGEDDSFDIAEVTDVELDQFPNLKRIEDAGAFLSTAARATLESRGIEIDD